LTALTPKRPAAAPAHPAAAPCGADELAYARSIIRAESAAIDSLLPTLGPAFTKAVDLLAACADSGTVLITGLGKSGLIGAKISATLASLGIPSHSVHPSEAAHGDLGRFRPTDTVIALSFSGETEEVVNLALRLKQDNIPIIAITRGEPAPGDARPLSSLARIATVHLPIPIDGEAGDVEFAAPTCSTTATLALGDALALCAARRRNFSDQDFAKRHPGGALGTLLRPVQEIMRFKVGHNCPLVAEDTTVLAALSRVEVGRRPGAMLVVDKLNRLTGVFTDGDLRRLIARQGQDVVHRPLREIMTRQPKTLRHDAPLRDAVKLILELRLDEIPVVDSGDHPIGILDVQDLMALKLVKD
jgi:arabinose-5-phosphate isomerase